MAKKGKRLVGFVDNQTLYILGGAGVVLTAVYLHSQTFADAAKKAKGGGGGGKAAKGGGKAAKGAGKAGAGAGAAAGGTSGGGASCGIWCLCQGGSCAQDPAFKQPCASIGTACGGGGGGGGGGAAASGGGAATDTGGGAAATGGGTGFDLSSITGPLQNVWAQHKTLIIAGVALLIFLPIIKKMIK